MADSTENVIVYYYFYNGVAFGSLNHHKIECMSRRDSDGRVFSTKPDKAEVFGGVLLNEQWLG